MSRNNSNSNNLDYHCDICNVSCNSLDIFEVHTLGKKHQKNAQLQQRTVDRSVYVADFPKDPDIVEKLKTYFSTFGPVEEVYLDKRQKAFAFVKFVRLGSCSTCLKQKKHFLGGKEGALLYVEAKRDVSTGEIYNEPEPQKPAMDHSLPPAYDETMILDAIGGAKDVSYQMILLMSELELPREDLELRTVIKNMLQTTFREFFPGCDLHQFGSSISGLGIHGSDIDLFLDLNLDMKLPDYLLYTVPRPLPHVKNISALRGINRQYLTRDELAMLPLLDLAKISAAILENCVPGVSNVMPIPSTRCPIVRFLHMPSMKRIDLSFKNRLAIYNSRFIKFCCNFDVRFRPLVYTIRFWAMKKGLSGPGVKFTNYSITLLIIFYLQNIDKPLIPTVEYLASLCGDVEQVIVDHWDCSFCTDIKRIKPNNNCQSPAELLVGFFKFYHGFDFANNVICVRTGETVKAARMMARKPECKVTCISVQDPFNLDHNTTQNVNEYFFNQFCLRIEQAIKKTQDSMFHEARASYLWGLKYLFTDQGEDKSAPASTSVHQKKREIEQLFNVIMEPSKCPKFFEKAVQDLTLDLNSAWGAYASRGLRDVFEKVFQAEVVTLFERDCDTVPVEFEIKWPECDDNITFDDDDEDVYEGEPDEEVAECQDEVMAEDEGDTPSAAAGEKRPLSDNGDVSDPKKSKTDETEKEDLPEIAAIDHETLVEYDKKVETCLVFRARFTTMFWKERKHMAEKIFKTNYDVLSYEAKLSDMVRKCGLYQFKGGAMDVLVELYQNELPTSLQVVFKLENPKFRGEFNTMVAFTKQSTEKIFLNL